MTWTKPQLGKQHGLFQPTRTPSPIWVIRNWTSSSMSEGGYLSTDVLV